MKTIALTGPYNANTRETLHAEVPDGFRLIDVPAREDYGLLADADYIIIRTIRVEGDDVRNSPNLRLVHKWGVGYDNIDVPGVSALDIPIAICTGVNAPPVAEMAVLHMLALYRNFLALNSTIRANVWVKDQFSSKSYMIGGKTVGIVGLGNIGGRVAQIVRGFGAKVQYFDVKRRSPERERELGAAFVPFEELLRTSDIVSLHLPLSDDSRNLMNAGTLAMMKPSAILVNTARGGVVDEAALADALRDGVIAGAGLDAFKSEPPGADCPFYAMENVTLSPHIGGNTADNDINMIRRLFDNIVKFDGGGRLGAGDVVNNHLLKTRLELED